LGIVSTRRCIRHVAETDVDVQADLVARDFAHLPERPPIDGRAHAHLRANGSSIRTGADQPKLDPMILVRVVVR
jgi:hypothetical protein